MPQIEVSFDLDTNGILSVRAKDKGTGKEQHITIQGSTGLSKEEVEKMQKDAEINAEADKKKKEAIDARNQADALVFTIEKQMREYDAKIPDPVKKKVNEAIGELKDVLKDADASVDAIKKATDKLGTEAQEIGKVVYEEAQKKDQEKTDASSKKDDKKGKKGKDDAVDAEVVDEE